MDSIFQDMESKNLISFGQIPKHKLYARSNSLENIADFEYILHYCKPMEQDTVYWTLRGLTMMIAGGSRRINYG